jgi:hypothetical protein
MTQKHNQMANGPEKPAAITIRSKTNIMANDNRDSTFLPR